MKYSPLVLAAMIGVSGCAGLELQNSNGIATSDGYGSALYENYLRLSAYEYSIGHYASSDEYARRARLAAAGRPIEPFTANNNSYPMGTVPAGEVSAMTEGRQALVAAMSGNGARVAPMDLAKAQTSYDCWIEEQSYTGSPAESNQPDRVKLCRDEFNQAIGSVQTAMRPASVPVAQAAPAVTPRPVVQAQVPSSYMVFFNWGSADVSNEARQVLNLAADNIRKSGTQTVALVGHADRSGPTQFNMKLSEERARAIENSLGVTGWAGPAFTTTWKGENEPLVDTIDGVREPQNRRVQITFSNMPAANTASGSATSTAQRQ